MSSNHGVRPPADRPTQVTVPPNIVMDDGSYDCNKAEGNPEEDPYRLFQEFSSLLSERNVESGTVFSQYYRQKIYQLVWSSNMIENVGADLSLTLGLCQHVFGGWPASELLLYFDSVRSQREITHHAKAAGYIFGEIGKGNGLSEDLIRNTHAVLTCGIDMEDGTPWTEFSGKYRRGPARTSSYQFMHKDKVPSAMRQMVRDYNEEVLQAIESGQIDPIALAAKYSHTFIYIHPFECGNGRISRLILNAILFKFTLCLVPFGQDENGRTEYKDLVMDALLKEGVCDVLELEGLPKEFRPRNWIGLASFILKHALETMREMHQLGQSWSRGQSGT
ncbi:fido domain-containing protein [Fusarium flagelliforme]|uniref:Fido domain-containing protein n=1 Tax=Fusarium flagelliforme TaxID=2675880 RepID=A0A395MDA2_9HYPO|nr:fido domain-containing protein [Fusarium flagelliforme]KAH7179221.1 fido domain-containing protein [Fusarium flagelliforme]RFN45845.1 hypothetical protein FIE12Z_9925 [Fusarium flagelliforme]